MENAHQAGPTEAGIDPAERLRARRERPGGAEESTATTRNNRDTMIRGETLRLRIRAECDESGSSRAVDIRAKTQLDVVAQVLRAVTNHERDENQ